MNDAWKWLILIGCGCVILGGILWTLGKLGLPFGQLPGDVSVTGEKFSFYFPIVSSIVLSIVLTLLINFFLSYFKK